MQADREVDQGIALCVGDINRVAQTARRSAAAVVAIDESGDDKVAETRGERIQSSVAKRVVRYVRGGNSTASLGTDRDRWIRASLQELFCRRDVAHQVWPRRPE